MAEDPELWHAIGRLVQIVEHAELQHANFLGGKTPSDFSHAGSMKYGDVTKTIAEVKSQIKSLKNAVSIYNTKIKQKDLKLKEASKDKNMDEAKYEKEKKTLVDAKTAVDGLLIALDGYLSNLEKLEKELVAVHAAQDDVKVTKEKLEKQAKEMQAKLEKQAKDMQDKIDKQLKTNETTVKDKEKVEKDKQTSCEKAAEIISSQKPKVDASTASAKPLMDAASGIS